MSAQLRIDGPEGGLRLGAEEPLAIIAGPCVIESLDACLAIAEHLRELGDTLGIPVIFKSSFDKANRTSVSSFRGPGMQEGLEVLRRVRETTGLPVTTDVHLPSQAAAVAEVADLLQVPAFLCRQTDLLLACAATGTPVNVKKGQFLAPWDMKPVVGKLQAGGATGIALTERGTSFGYNALVTDMRGLVTMRELGVPVVFDATHSVQQPAVHGDSTGGDRSMAPVLARGAVAVGVDAVFMEVHPDPDQAPSDGPNMLPLDWLPALWRTLKDLDAVVKG